MRKGNAYEVLYHDVFKAWFEKLRKSDIASHMRISKRLRQIEAGGLFCDKKYVGGGVWELRFHWSPGYRVYYAQCGSDIIVLLCGGNKSEQGKDIESAKKIIKRGVGMEKKIPELTRFDILDCIDSEEYAKGYLGVWAENNGAGTGTPKDIDNVWGDIRQASERHGFPITPALQDTYAEVRAVCAEVHTAAEPAFA